jgi:hypothetical protein
MPNPVLHNKYLQPIGTTTRVASGLATNFGSGQNNPMVFVFGVTPSTNSHISCVWGGGSTGTFTKLFDQVLTDKRFSIWASNEANINYGGTANVTLTFNSPPSFGVAVFNIWRDAVQTYPSNFDTNSGLDNSPPFTITTGLLAGDMWTNDTKINFASGNGSPSGGSSDTPIYSTAQGGNAIIAQYRNAASMAAMTQNASAPTTFGSIVFPLNYQAPGGSVPANPTGLSSPSSDHAQVQLSWTDNSTNEAGFRIERKIGAGGTYGTVGSVGANVAGFTDSLVSPSTDYYYRVYAFNAALEDSAAPTNEVNVVTPAAPASTRRIFIID